MQNEMEYFPYLMNNFEKIAETDSLCNKSIKNTEKIEKFVREIIKYINKSILTNKLQQKEIVLELATVNFKTDFIEYYLNDSNSEPRILEKYIQSQPPILSHDEEVSQYGFTRLVKSTYIGKIKSEFSTLPFWDDLLKETLSCFRTTFNKDNRIKHNFFVSFGSLPERNIECCLFVATEYLTEWFVDFSPSPINLLPVVFIYGKVSLW